jgi:hypothetical protein
MTFINIDRFLKGSKGCPARPQVADIGASRWGLSVYNRESLMVRRVAPYTPTRSCVHIGVLKTKIKSKKNK